MTERIKHMKETLMACVEGQMANLQQADTKELSEAIDMIKDLEEAMYYCTITKAMEEKEKSKKEEHYHYYNSSPSMNYNMDRQYYDKMYYPGQPRDSQGRFTSDGRRNYEYYDGNGSNSSNGNSNSSGRNNYSYYSEMEVRDAREGRSPASRRMYMETKEMHKDKATKMKELENYIKELSGDLVEMIEDASPEERQFLSKKMSTLATKLENA